MFFKRRLPAARRPSLGRDERVIGWARTRDDRTVVATNVGIWLPDQAGWRDRVGWHEIHKARWTGTELVITAAEVVADRDGYVVTADQPPVAVTLRDPGELPAVVRSRVTRSVSFSSHEWVPGGGVRVVARKVPGIDGLSWAVRYDEGTDPAGPGVAEATGELVAGFAQASQQPG